MRDKARQQSTLFFLIVMSMLACSNARASSCNFNAYLGDRDPRGTNIRKAPSLSSPVVGKISNAAHGSELSAEFKVLEVKGNWVLVDNDDPEADEPWTKSGFKNYVGKGWVAAPLVRVDPYDSVFYNIPSKNSAVVFDIDPKKNTPPDGLFGLLKTKTLIGCDGQWAKFKTEHGTGWVARVCGNPKTTCS